MFIIQLLMVPLWQRFGWPSKNQQQPPYWDLFRLHFVGELMFYSWVYWAIVGVSYAVDY
jgi:hypothetical protein